MIIEFVLGTVALKLLERVTDDFYDAVKARWWGDTRTLPPLAPGSERAAQGYLPVPRLATSAATLLVLGGPSRGLRCFDNREFMTIGAAADNDIVLDPHNVSQYHAVIRQVRGGMFVLYDAGSESGTYVNGQKATGRPLSDADVLGIGGHRIVFSTALWTPVTGGSAIARAAPAAGAMPLLAGQGRSAFRFVSTDTGTLEPFETAESLDIVSRSLGARWAIQSRRPPDASPWQDPWAAPGALSLSAFSRRVAAQAAASSPPQKKPARFGTGPNPNASPATPEQVARFLTARPTFRINSSTGGTAPAARQQTRASSPAVTVFSRLVAERAGGPGPLSPSRLEPADLNSFLHRWYDDDGDLRSQPFAGQAQRTFRWQRPG